MGMHAMNPSSRMWFYGLTQPLSEAQSEELVQLMDEFVSQWKAHGAQLAAAYQWINHQFLFIAVDEGQQQATGCSIDKSVHLLQEFGAKHSVDFFNRMLVYAQTGEGFISYSTATLKAAIAEGLVDENTPVMHTTAATLGEIGSGLIPLKESWAARFLYH